VATVTFLSAGEDRPITDVCAYSVIIFYFFILYRLLARLRIYISDIDPKLSEVLCTNPTKREKKKPLRDSNAI